MARERQTHNILQAAERLLKQGKVDEALATLERVAVGAPSDLLTLNRLGDLLARQGRAVEAARYYLKIAEEFSRAGFYPKAIAIHKKIIRLNADDVHSLAELGRLYLEQKLPGEARNYLLRAAELSLQAKDFAGARSVYEQLVAAEPGDPRHRARLAETRAAEGDLEQAGQELLLLADSLFTQGKPAEAEQSYRRAAELLPDSPDPLLGICKSITEQGRGPEAQTILEAEAKKDSPNPAILGELALRYVTSNHEDDALALLRRPGAMEMPAESLLRLFRHYLDEGEIQLFWERMDAVFETWAEQGSTGRLEAIYTRLGTLEKTGHAPALERLFTLTESAGDKTGMTRALEGLVRSYSAQSLEDDLNRTMERLRQVAPKSALVSAAEPTKKGPAAPADPAPAHAQQAAAEDAASKPAETTDAEPLPVEWEAPAVPLNRTDEEFVAGRLTQAEILEKYGLIDQALAQVAEVTAKFAGHVAAQERLVSLLRGGNERARLGESLIGLGLARRAAGDSAAARSAIGEGDQIKSLPDASRQRLVRLGLLDDAPGKSEAEAAPVEVPPVEAAPVDAPPVEAAPVDAPPVEAAPVEVPPVEAAPVTTPERAPEAAKTPPPQAASPASSDDAAVVIDFDALDDEDGEEEPAIEPPAEPAPVEQPAVAVSAGPRVRAPGDDMLEEIRLQLRGGQADEAGRRVETLRTLGYGSTELDGLEQEIVSARQPSPAVPPPTPTADAPAGDQQEIQETAAELEALAAPIAEDDDLSTITAALESELFSEEEQEAPVPEAQSEQSLEDVFAAFKQHVAEEVDSDDFRTHYDLGIAYKEMGLMDEAIAEFETAVASPEMLRGAAIMLGLCHREQNQMGDAAGWYRRALESGGGDDDSSHGLRYDLAEVLLEDGDAAGALEQFRHLLQADPSFRDVQERIEQIEARQTS